MESGKFDSQKFGNNLRTIRSYRKISVDKIARNANVSPEHIRNIETGNAKPSVDVLVSIANTLNVSSDDLLKGMLPYMNHSNTVLLEAVNELSGDSLDFYFEIISLIKKHISKS